MGQVGDGHLAEKALRNALLSAQGAEFALGPLHGLGELFAEARLLFRRQRRPVEDHAMGAMEKRSPSPLMETIH